jgi:hypothetical protein
VVDSDVACSFLRLNLVGSDVACSFLRLNLVGIGVDVPCGSLRFVTNSEPPIQLPAIPVARDFNLYDLAFGGGVGFSSVVYEPGNHSGFSFRKAMPRQSPAQMHGQIHSEVKYGPLLGVA